MSKVIDLPEGLYQRLASHADGFETPSSVIEKILDAYEGKEAKENNDNEVVISSKLDINFYLGSEKEFKEKFLVAKRAFVKLTFSNGSTEIKDWVSPNFIESSSVSGNLRSGYLRGWKKKGIVKAEVALSKSEFNT
ncbi:hypothetical protein EKG38_06125 [Shewanella canadensis]|uniref:Uncharacterized protein n=1 Tax=Shewanella canadensis TaxID=271096 RepID=A0A3S0L3G7_9GAMM|nr:hypothetical protein [Shewanella canadensis]RTR40290.1 hypothetical protein EKG38_06125 [Shewanella canadensis]